MSLAKGRSPEEWREAMKHYMRAYRAWKRGLGPKPTTTKAPNAGCQQCGCELTGKKTLYCSRRCYHRAHYERNRERISARDRERYNANPAAWIARVRKWEADNPERVRAYYRAYRKKTYKACPFCGTPRAGANACVKCWFKFGSACRNNEFCGEPGRHKHCVSCWMPISKPKTLHRKVEFCAACEIERRRGAFMGYESQEVA